MVTYTPAGTQTGKICVHIWYSLIDCFWFITAISTKIIWATLSQSRAFSPSSCSSCYLVLLFFYSWCSFDFFLFVDVMFWFVISFFFLQICNLLLLVTALGICWSYVIISAGAGQWTTTLNSLNMRDLKGCHFLMNHQFKMVYNININFNNVN